MDMQINCAVDGAPAARAAVEAGADWLTLTPPPLPRQHPGAALAEWFDALQEPLQQARRRGIRVAVSLPARVDGDRIGRYEIMIDALARVGVDALVLADLGLLRYADERAPLLDLHVAPQAAIGSAAALAFYVKRFGVERACLANTLDVKTVARIARAGHAEVEVFGYGAAGAMLEGLCSLSAYFAGHSATRDGACAPSIATSRERSARFRSVRLNGVLVDSAPAETTLSHPAMCTGRYRIGERSTHLFGGRNGIGTLKRLPELMLAGVRSVRLAPCGPDLDAAARMVRAWREAIAACRHDPERYELRPQWRAALGASQTALPCTVSATAHR